MNRAQRPTDAVVAANFPDGMMRVGSRPAMVATENLSLHEALGSPRLTAGSPAMLSIDLPRLINEQDEPMRLLASWLRDEHEGEVFFSGSGGALTVPIPADALGYRLRRWPSEGLAPEYLDWRFRDTEG